MSPTAFSNVKFVASYSIFSVQLFWSMGEFCCSSCYYSVTGFGFFCKKGNSRAILAMMHLFLIGVLLVTIMVSFILLGLPICFTRRRGEKNVNLSRYCLIDSRIMLLFFFLIILINCYYDLWGFTLSFL